MSCIVSLGEGRRAGGARGVLSLRGRAALKGRFSRHFVYKQGLKRLGFGEFIISRILKLRVGEF